MPSLTLFRRHGIACPASRPADSYSTEAEERRRSWKKCDCRIYAHGTLDGHFRKFATKARDWEFAREIVAPYLAAGRWDITPPDPPPPPPPHSGEVRESPIPHSGTGRQGTPIPDAVKDLLAEHKNAQSAVGTIRKYRDILRLMERFSAREGLRYVEEWNAAYVKAIRTGWQEKGNRPVTVQKKLKVLRAFFQPFVELKVLSENPAASVKVRKNRALQAAGGSNSKQVDPYTDPELERMIRAALALRPHRSEQVVSIARFRHHRQWSWTGEDLVDFMQLSYFTGLRISDVALFNISRLTPQGEVRLRATKNGQWISVWIPEWLRERIRIRARKFGPQIFGTHATADLNHITDLWRRRLIAVWAKCGPWEQKPTPHRFRHTFIRLLLERGVPVAIVAELAGDTEKMIHRHYAAWIPSRQEKMSAILAEAFRDVPRFHQA